MPSLFSVATAHDLTALSGPVISRDASLKTSHADCSSVFSFLLKGK